MLKSNVLTPLGNTTNTMIETFKMPLLPVNKSSHITKGYLTEIFAIFLRLGFTSFGGPIAHIGFFHNEFVENRKWVTESTYADIVALCQFLPGPSSSQVGIMLGMIRAGFWGGITAWIGFTAPSALAMMAFGYEINQLGSLSNVAWLHGLKIVAVAVVAQSVWGMYLTLCPDIERSIIAVAATLFILAVPSAGSQIIAIILGGTFGRLFLQSNYDTTSIPLQINIGINYAVFSFVLFFCLLIGLPILATATGNHSLELLSGFYRSGSLVFGGGHVVLPLLQEAVVPTGWITNDAFLAGYGASQALPGPLFTFAAYLGTVLNEVPNGWEGGLICLLAIYLPSFLLLIAALPFWNALRHRADVQSALKGVNATVVGILLGALYAPVFTSAIFGMIDFSIAVAAFVFLVFLRTPPWLVVVLGACTTSILQLLA